MAAPNLISISTVIGKTRADWCTTSFVTILENGANTGQVIRINSLFVTNVGLADAGAFVDLLRSGLSFYMSYNNLISTGSTTVLMGKDTGIYLEEGDSLRIRASASSTLQYMVSYELIS